jgi:hypothetical protein
VRKKETVRVRVGMGRGIWSEDAIRISTVLVDGVFS